MITKEIRNLDKVVWNMPVIILHNIVIMPDSNSNIDVVTPESCKAVEKAMAMDNIVFLLSVDSMDDLDKGDIKRIGVVAKIKQMLKLPDKTMRILLETTSRGNVELLNKDDDAYNGDVELLPDEEPDRDDKEAEALKRMLENKVKQAYSNGLGTNKIMYAQIVKTLVLSKMCNRVAEFVPLPPDKKRILIAMDDVKERAEILIGYIDDELEILTIRNEIQEKLKECVNKHQREYVLREQLKVIKKELGEDDTDEIADEYDKKLSELGAPEEVTDKIKKEIGRFKSLPSMAPESGVLSNYIETLLDYPWNKSSEENGDLNKAIKILERDHYGLDDVKERIIDYLAVRILNKKGNMPIICLVGPPGTGKTSIARSIAEATGKEYIRLSLGGVRDEAEIRGHRKTYVGAMPGRIVQSIARTGTNNPLVLLDEIDKVSSDYKGDVSSALLEVLDSEQNNKFMDHYFEVPVDLSQVLFIATANDASTIPGPLLDRMEIIEISGYTENEKYNIARLYLVKKCIERNGLTKNQLKINSDAIRYVIRNYTREAGVRSLERNIDRICRKACREILCGEEGCVKVTKKNVSEYLGTEKYMEEKQRLNNKIGAVRGLAWTSVGGVTLDIEVNVFPGNGQLELTGKMGDVMKESAVAGLSYVRSLKECEKLGNDFFETHDIHIHIPEGAVPKDGPSAGITMATALYSAIFKKAVKGNLAMTGEITIRGDVLPIGGLKEKMLAAKLIGITNLIIPAGNKRDLNDIASDIKDGLNIVFATDMSQVLDNAIV